MKKFVIIILSFTLISCVKNNVNAEFIEIKDNIARFDVVNTSNKDIEKLTFEIKYFDNLDNILLIDTIDYQNSKKYFSAKTPFLKANDETFFVQSIPNNCKKAAIKVLEIDYLDNN